MASGSAVQTNGLGSLLYFSTKRLIASCGAASEAKLPRLRGRGVGGRAGQARDEPCSKYREAV